MFSIAPITESDSQDGMLRGLGMLDWWSKRHTFAIAAIIVAAFLLHLAFTHSLPRMVKWDESDYLLLGRNLVTGQGYTTGFEPEIHHPPFFPLITGAIYPAVGDLEKSSDIAYALFGGLMLLPRRGVELRGQRRVASSENFRRHLDSTTGW